MVTNVSRVKVSTWKFIVRIIQSRFGGYVIYKMRSAPFGFWTKSKPLRMILISWGQEKRLNPEISRRVIFPGLGTEFLFCKAPPKLDLKSSSKHIQIFSPETLGAFHNISNLALYQAKILSSKYAVQTLLAPNVVSLFRDSFNVLLDPNVSENGFGTSIYHLGNHPSSILVLKHFLLDQSNRKILVLHDINLVDLALAYCVQEQIDTEFFFFIESKLGAAGSIAINKKLNSEQLSPIESKNLVRVILVELLEHADAIATHQDLQLYLGELPAHIKKKSYLIDLPIGYFSNPSHSTNVFRVKKRLVISGHSSGAKEVIKIVEAICLAMELDTIITCYVIGKIESEVRKALSTLGYSKNYGASFIFFQKANDEEWELLHRSCELGTRFGVGTNGENSGLVRDYLYFGLKVITDEDSKVVRETERAVILSRDVDTLGLANAIHGELAFSHLDIDLNQELTEQRYLNQLSALLESFTND